MKSAFGENPKRCYGSKGKMPENPHGYRRGDARSSVRRPRIFAKMAGPEDKRPAFDLKKDALAKVLRREIPLKMHAAPRDDILTAIRIARGIPVKLLH